MRYPVLFSNVLKADLKVVAFVVAVFVYAMFGAPTPDALSWVEGGVGVSLLFVIGVHGFASVFRQNDDGERWFVPWFLWGQVFLLYGLVAGVVGGLMRDAGMGAMLRDLLPFGFMFLPLFLIGFVQDERRAHALLYMFLVLGLVFALRTSSLILDFDVYLGYEALSYLANSPAVLFAGLFLFGSGLQALSRRLDVRALLSAGLCFGLCFLAMMPIVLTAQRASMAAFAIYAILAFGFLFVKSPRRMMVVGSVMVALSAIFLSGMIGDAVNSIAAKSAIAGDNQRIQDVIAVWDAISGHPLSMMFGQGWGASFASPAVMDIEVNFTHSLLSSMLLKLGIVGMVLCLAYVGALLFVLMRALKVQPIIVMALMAPFLIDVFLYAAFKSLDFGLLLVLISCVTLFQRYAQRIASSPRVLYEKA